MGIRHFVLPPAKMEVVPSTGQWDNLKNKFSGKTLFRKQLYRLETGDLSVIGTVGNKWFYEEIMTYAVAFRDKSLLPALKKITVSSNLDEGIRRKASGAYERIASQTESVDTAQKATTQSNEFTRAENAHVTLAGTRYPQTTEIFKLLKDKSPELKRLALFLIGKFRMTDMIQEVCECLTLTGVENDAYEVMKSLGPAVERDIDRCYLKTAGNVNSSKVLLRLMAEIHQPADLSFLVERLSSNSRLLREISLDTLTASGFSMNETGKERLKANINETFGTLTWIISILIPLEEGKSGFLSGELKKEYERWKEYLLKLLHLVYNEKVEEDVNNPIPEMASLIFGSPDEKGSRSKTLKKLRQWFPLEIPSFTGLVEDIINCDYNILGVWTKACALRSVPALGDASLGESVAALLFSPDQILREEAARLLSRSSMELYRSTSSRIPEKNRIHLDRIVSDQTNDRELMLDKVRFLASCFGQIREDDLLFLAGQLLFARNDQRGLYSQPSDTVMWSFSDENDEPEVHVSHEDLTDPGRIARDIRSACNFCYVLPLKSISEFDFRCPESSFGIFRYIDKYEG
ncbi:MAG: hypothetical protein WAW07_02845 [Bacteroidales bacterium]